ncbi:MAG: type pilus assembly protein PilN [Clostridia bacterium]|nr:type pilus assembly protein PilN [Clostridia bacterium]
MHAVNLLPPELRPRRFVVLGPKQVALAFLLALSLALAYFPLANSFLARQLQQIERELALLGPQVQKVENLAASLEREAAEDKVLTQRAAGRRALSPFLESLDSSLPPGIWLVELQVSAQGEINLKGKALGLEPVGELLNNLQVRAGLKEVVLPEIKADPEGSYVSFVVKARL